MVIMPDWGQPGSVQVRARVRSYLPYDISNGGKGQYLLGDAEASNKGIQLL